MDSRVKFWTTREGWPPDTASHIFLGNAVNEMGKALFGSKWNGGEPAVELMQPLPKQKLEGSGWRPHYANDLLVRHHPEFDRKLTTLPIASPSGGFSSTPAYLRFTDKEWAAVTAIVARDHEAKRPAIERFSTVKATLIRLAEAEQLTTALRPVLGGDPVPVNRSLWNSERLDVRFMYCQMNRREPFGAADSGKDFEFIFVTRESLDRCLAALTAPRQPAEHGTTPRNAAATPAEVTAAAPPQITERVSLQSATKSQGQVAARKRRRGRMPGVGSFADIDAPLLDEMKDLILSHKAANPGEAARLLAGKAHGTATLESKRDRLAKRYRAREDRV